jgi:hypothetical protein
MPILDIQERFRELGRIRTGVKEPTGKTYQKGPRKGQPIERPVKLPRFRLTSPWKHLIEQGAEAFGGPVQPWDNDGVAEWEVIVEADKLDVLVPPGEIFSQWYEQWSGGGCVKRCDGIRQVLQDRPCSCPKDPDERREKAAKGEACKPTTRLNVMIPAIDDLGVWRLESHGFYAASELAPAAGLCELATRQGAMIPADLRLVAREGARRPGQVRKKFFVPALSFRGALGPVLEALGMDTSAPAVLLGVQPRPALNAGGTPALPAARTPFDPQPPVEQATVPETQPEIPDDPFEPPLGGTPDGDDGSSSILARAQTIAMRCSEAGIDRHHLISAITGGRATSGKDVTAEEASELFLAVVKLRRGQLQLVELEPNVWRLVEPGGPAEVVSAPPAAPVGEASASTPDASSEVAKEEQAVPNVTAPSEWGDEDRWSGDQWRAFFAQRGVDVKVAFKEAQKLAIDFEEEPPASIDDLAGRTRLCTLVRGRIEDLSEGAGS